MNDQQSDLVRELLRAYGLDDASAAPMAEDPSGNQRVCDGSSQYFLKVIDGPMSEQRLISQMEFMQFLRDGGLPVVDILSATDGRRYARSADGQSFGILSQWIDGETVNQHCSPDRSRDCGRLLAQLHLRSETFRPSRNFDLQHWDDVYTGANSWLERFLENSQFDAAQRDLVSAAAVVIRGRLAKLPRNERSYGVIHADFHMENLIFDGSRIWIIDFEEIGWGHYLFDVAWPEALLTKSDNDARLLSDAFRDGYREVRPLSTVEEELQTVFRLAAGIGVLEMVHTAPLPHDSPIVRDWYAYGMDWLRKYLD